MVHEAAAKLPLRDLCEQIADCPHSTPVWTDNGVIVLRNQNIRNGRLDLSSPSYTDEDHYRQRVRRAEPRAGDLVITREAPMGEVCEIPPNIRCCLGQRMVLLRPDDMKCNGRYLLYAIQSRAVRHEILVNEGTGSTVSNLRIPILEQLPIPIFPLTEQRAIACILGALDDKIELNRRMNRTLEGTARAIFKSWFVNFDPVRAKAAGQPPPGLKPELAALFPDAFQDSELGEIPKGWRVVNLGELGDVDKGLSYKGAGLVDDGGLGMISLGCFGGNGTFKTDNVKRYCGEYRDRHVVQAGDLVIANTDMTQKRIILGSPALIPVVNGECRFLFTHHTFAFRFSRDAHHWRLHVYFTLLQPSFREIAEGYATGTTVLALPKDGLHKHEVVLPTEDLRDSFGRIASRLLEQSDLLHGQSRTLAALRDTLLPKLISGELRVPDAERIVGRAI